MSLFGLKSDVDLIIGVPSRGMVRIEWALMFSQISPPTNMTTGTKLALDLDVIEARNVLAKTMLDEGAEYLFFLDDDTFCGPQVLRQMHNQMAQHSDWDLITAITPMKSPDCEPNIYRTDQPGAYWGWTFGETFPIDACGLSCALIRRSAFEKVGEPWFGWKSTNVGGHYEELGEDVGFCKKLRDAGGILMADGRAICGHMDRKGQLFQLSTDTAPFERGAEELKRAVPVT